MNKDNKDEYVILCYTMALDCMLQPVNNTMHARISDVFDSVDEAVRRAHGLLYELSDVDGFDEFVDGYEPFKITIDPDHPDKVKTVIIKLTNGGYSLVMLKIESVEQLAESF